MDAGQKGVRDMTYYVIKQTNSELYWSSNYGWSSLDDADTFSYEEHMMFPMLIKTSEWVCMDSMQ